MAERARYGLLAQRVQQLRSRQGECVLEAAAEATHARVMTVDVEGRSAEELPEHHLAAFTICHLDPAEVGPTPPEWPSTSADIPGELIGSYASGRDGKEPLSWQSTRAILSDEKGKKSHRRLWSKG